ncbi:MAG: hypothetical protein LBS51_05380 [Oscillospiraceae bacterium]|nr:hypothetical protein [Oscillospiraceae bacterium]
MSILGILKSRKTAVIALALSIAIFTPSGVRLSFGREAGKVEDMFYSGVYIEDDGYTAPPLYAQIQECQTGALGLLTVAANYSGGDIDELTERLRDARETSLADVYNTKSGPVKKEIHYRYLEYISMYGYAIELHKALADAGMDARDRAAADDYIKTADSSFALAMRQAAALTEKSDELHALTRVFPMWYIGGRRAYFDAISNVTTPTDGYTEAEVEGWLFRLEDGKLITGKYGDIKYNNGELTTT